MTYHAELGDSGTYLGSQIQKFEFPDQIKHLKHKVFDLVVKPIPNAECSEIIAVFF